MSKPKIIILALFSVSLWFLVYSPHWNYAFPFHVDEWHHIGRALDFTQFKTGSASNLEIGFHLLLFLISWPFDLVSIYRFLPAIWAALTALTLFLITYRLSNKNFPLAILTMVFFASIKSNVNLEGPWFFTPLTFSAPLIYFYSYLWAAGLNKQNKKCLLAAGVVATLLIPFHPLAVSFAIPILLVSIIIHWRYCLSEYKFFAWFLLIPVAAVLFYKYMVGISWFTLWSSAAARLLFPSGWGVVEVSNSPLEIYSWIGYVLAVFGWLIIFSQPKLRKRYFVFLIWPVVLIIFLLGYRLSGVSLFSPMQRNWFYLALALPLLSAHGLMFIFSYLKSHSKIILPGLILLVLLPLAFIDYYSLPSQFDLYRVIDGDDYRALKWLAGQPEGKILATSFISTAARPIAGQQPVADIYFQNKKRILVEQFFLNEQGCKSKNTIIKKLKPKYVISKQPIACGWRLIYNDGDYVYQP